MFRLSSPSRFISGFLPSTPARAAAAVSARTVPRVAATPGPRLNLRLRRLSPKDEELLPQLCELLIDSVHRGACLGFLAPMSVGAAQDFWRGVLARLGPQEELWVACDDHDERPRLHGAVQLFMCPQLNAHHRGEVRGLMVHSQSRGRGVASRLMSRLECTALERGRQLLVLETPAGSQAEAVYTHLGWQRAGEIPGYAACAEGRLHSAALMFKHLRTPMALT